MENENAVIENVPQVIAKEADRLMNIFFNTADFEEAQRKAKLIAHSNFTPERYKGNIGDCVIALDMAQRLQMSPITILQELYIVHGTPGFSSKFLIALINARGGYVQDLEFEQTSNSCYAWTINKQGRKLIGPTVTLEMAKREGWIDKKGSKWVTMPEVMLSYRAASFFAKKFCPSLTLGMQSLEEILDITPIVEKDITPPKDVTAVNETIGLTNEHQAKQKLRDALTQKPKTNAAANVTPAD